MNNAPMPIEYSNQRILTTEQIAEFYGTDEKVISKNFTRNKDRYVPGKHYYLLEGNELKKFKETNRQIDEQFKQARSLYLWTEKGALLHAKSLNTDLAWEKYDWLVDDYYRKIEELAELKSALLEADLTIDKLLWSQASLSTLFDFSCVVISHFEALEQIEETVANLKKRNTQNNIDRLESTMRLYIPNIKALKKAFNESIENFKETRKIMQLYHHIGRKFFPETFH